MTVSLSQTRALLSVLALLVLTGLVACQRPGEETPVPSDPTPTQTVPDGSTPAPTATAKQTATSQGTNGRIVYLGTDFQVYTADPFGAESVPITRGDGSYSWPGWSRDGGRLVYSSFSQAAALYSAAASGAEPFVIYLNAPGTGSVAGPRAPHYALWSPNGLYITFLAVEESGLSLYVVPASGQQEARRIATGAPLYMSWSSDSRSLLVHQSTGLFRVDMDAQGRLLDLEAESLAYRAPAWSPDGNSTAFVVTEADRHVLYVGRFDGSRRREVAEVQGIGAFQWSPEGDRLAIGQSMNEGDPLLRDIRVVDIESGDGMTLVEGTVMAFFWSPDGSRLAYVTTNTEGTAFQWRVVDAATGADRKVADFFPSSDQVIWLTYFDQYAYSHQVWSPDSRYLVFAGTLAETTGDAQTSRVYVLDVDGAEPPLALATGLLASWSQG